MNETLMSPSTPRTGSPRGPVPSGKVSPTWQAPRETQSTPWIGSQKGPAPSGQDSPSWPTPTTGSFNTLICASYAFSMAAIYNLADILNEFQRLMNQLASDLAKTMGGYVDSSGNIVNGVIQFGMADTEASGEHEANALKDQAYGSLASMGVSVAGGIGMGVSAKSMSNEVKEPQIKADDAKAFQSALRAPPSANAAIEIREPGVAGKSAPIIQKWSDGDVSGFKNVAKPNPDYKWYKPWQPKTISSPEPTSVDAGKAMDLLKLDAKGPAATPLGQTTFGKVQKSAATEIKDQTTKISAASTDHNSRVQYIDLAVKAGNSAADGASKFTAAIETQDKANEDAAAAGERAAQQSIADNLSATQTKAGENHKEANEMLQQIQAMASAARGA